MKGRFRRVCQFTPVAFFLAATAFAVEIRKESYWKVDDVRPGMTGYGMTVVKGTQPERFNAEVLGIIKAFSPGQDLVIVRLAGLGLEKTGVISGMSGSPVYLDGKLLGAVAYTWSFGTEPIGGVTLFSQMVDYTNPKKRDVNVARSEIENYLLDGPVPVLSGGCTPAAFDATGISAVAGGGSLVPIASPVVATGLSEAVREALAPHLAQNGMFLVQGGAAGKSVAEQHAQAKIVPGGAMAVGMVTGDVTMTAIGTVTAVVGNRVWGFGHPFSGGGDCEMPLLTAYIHAVVPRQTISSKLGSPLTCAGMIDADASTAVAGWLGKRADMIPVSMRFYNRAWKSEERNFECQVIRDRSMVGPLAMSALASCGTLEGQAPLDLAARLSATVELEGCAPLVIDDFVSGPQFGGSRGLLRLYSPLANLLSILSNNNVHRPRILRLRCTTELDDRQRGAEIYQARVEPRELEAGQTLKVYVALKPHQPAGKTGPVALEEVAVNLPLPANLKPGRYSAMIGDSLSDLRNELRARPHLATPTDFNQLYDFLKLQLAMRQTDLVVRLNLPEIGVAVDGGELPGIPGGIADTLARDGTRRVLPVAASLVQKQKTDWALEGMQTVSFEVVERRGFYSFDK